MLATGLKRAYGQTRSVWKSSAAKTGLIQLAGKTSRFPRGRRYLSTFLEQMYDKNCFLISHTGSIWLAKLLKFYAGLTFINCDKIIQDT